jgi:hypothetical protein
MSDNDRIRALTAELASARRERDHLQASWLDNLALIKERDAALANSAKWKAACEKEAHNDIESRAELEQAQHERDAALAMAETPHWARHGRYIPDCGDCEDLRKARAEAEKARKDAEYAWSVANTILPEDKDSARWKAEAEAQRKQADTLAGVAKRAQDEAEALRAYGLQLTKALDAVMKMGRDRLARFGRLTPDVLTTMEELFNEAIGQETIDELARLAPAKGKCPGYFGGHCDPCLDGKGDCDLDAHCPVCREASE